MVGRTSKPFNPMLGETFEYITKDIKFYSEAVCHHPPIFAMVFESEFYEISRVCETQQTFNGTQVVVKDVNWNKCEFKPIRGRQSEKISWNSPALVVGNLMGVGGKGRYVEP